MLDAVLEQTHPRRDGIAFDFLIPAGCDRSARPGDNYHSPLGDISLEFPDESRAIHSVGRLHYDPVPCRLSRVKAARLDLRETTSRGPLQPGEEIAGIHRL